MKFLCIKHINTEVGFNISTQFVWCKCRYHGNHGYNRALYLLSMIQWSLNFSILIQIKGSFHYLIVWLQIHYNELFT